ncbi:MAG TPA: TIGR03936 family radical SAM-associated protein [Acidimicrobiales bacterium]|nr:TIGR03936 family radical SAM-associated protein [Acidimicrobiales bacterium]
MRIRIRFAKTGKVRWTSHRDVARMWERALRRVRLPVAYTEGFSPRPRVSFGLALPTGHESDAEYLDVELAGPGGREHELTDLPAALSDALPDGVDVLAAAVLDGRVPSLQHDVTSCSWEVEVVDVGQVQMAGLVDGALKASQLLVTRERKGRQVTDDLRPAIVSLGVLEGQQEGTLLGTELATHPRGVRPHELLQALGPGLEAGRVRRTHQWIERDGARWEPLPPGATHAPHAWERAS